MDDNQSPNRVYIKTSTKVIIAVFALIFLLIIVTCANYVSVVGEHSLVQSQESDRICRRRAWGHVVSLSETNLNHTMHLAERFPYVVAVTRNSTGIWSFACFASVILMKWIVIAAHCSENDLNHTMHLAERFPYVVAVTKNSTSILWSSAGFANVILVKWIVTAAYCRSPGHAHRVILYHDFALNKTHAFPILFWRIHERYNKTQFLTKYDIAVAKLNVMNYQFTLRPAVFDESIATEVEASVWKTVSTMSKKLYLTNQFDKYDVKIGNAGKCFESYGIEIDDSLICVDTSDIEDCFAHNFGPIYSGDKIVGLLLIKPVDCDTKLSIFTNVSFYTDWILKTTHD